jgi:exopolysaccharide biosynthesis predicted pyruvyltransferase EpsI
LEGLLAQFKIIEQVLKEDIKKGPVYYVPNPGNWGDGLIREGTKKFFRDINLEYREIFPSKRNWSDWILPSVQGGTVIYGGGGGWCKNHGNAAKYVNFFRKRFNVIVLPSSYQFTYAYPNTFFFRRDKFESKQNMPDSIYCHDMAFYLGEIRMQKGKGTGYFFRWDMESSGKIDIPKGNIDLSSHGNYMSEGITFLQHLSSYSEIHTDRLHVAIASSLLGLELHFYPGAYFKNYAVYRSSMKDHFENVTFHTEYLDSAIPKETELAFQ